MIQHYEITSVYIEEGRERCVLHHGENIEKRRVEI